MGRERIGEDWAAWMSGQVATGVDAAVAPATDVVPAVGPHVAPSHHPSPGPVPGPTLPADPDLTPFVARPGSARREATRQRVLDAAREVFAERGVFGGSVEDICDRAGFTRGAFYSNFADKDDVLEAVIEREHGRHVARLDASFALVDREVAEAPDLAAALSSIVDQILRSLPIDRQRSLIQAELEIHAIRRPELARPFLEANLRFRDRIAAYVEDAMARHGLELSVDAADVVDATVAIVDRSVRRALLAGGGPDSDAMARQILPALLLSAARPRPG